MGLVGYLGFFGSSKREKSHPLRWKEVQDTDQLLEELRISYVVHYVGQTLEQFDGWSDWRSDLPLEYLGQ